MSAVFKDAETARNFVLAGRAVVTLVSKKSGRRFTFRVKAPKKDADIRFVGVQQGPSNTSFEYLGNVYSDRTFAHGRKSKVDPEALSARAYRFFHDWLVGEHKLPPDMEVWHEGQCGRCGRPLTVPESIERGIGPECIKHVGDKRQGELL